MTEEEKELLERYDITVEHKSVYTYKRYKYDRLHDAVSNAKVEEERLGAARKASK